MTSIEMQIWIAAYSHNQPRAGSTSAEYWAACAVFHFRGSEEHVTGEQIRQLLEEVRAFSRQEFNVLQGIMQNEPKKVPCRMRYERPLACVLFDGHDGACHIERSDVGTVKG